MTREALNKDRFSDTSFSVDKNWHRRLRKQVRYVIEFSAQNDFADIDEARISGEQVFRVAIERF